MVSQQWGGGDGIPLGSRGSSCRRLLECVCASTGRLSVCCHHHHLVPPHGVAMPLVSRHQVGRRIKTLLVLVALQWRAVYHGWSELLYTCAMLVLASMHGWSHLMGGEVICTPPAILACPLPRHTGACRLVSSGCNNTDVPTCGRVGWLNMGTHTPTPELAILGPPCPAQQLEPTIAGCCGRAAGGMYM